MQQGHALSRACSIGSTMLALVTSGCVGDRPSFTEAIAGQPGISSGGVENGGARSSVIGGSTAQSRAVSGSLETGGAGAGPVGGIETGGHFTTATVTSVGGWEASVSVGGNGSAGAARASEAGGSTSNGSSGSGSMASGGAFHEGGQLGLGGTVSSAGGPPFERDSPTSAPPSCRNLLSSCRNESCCTSIRMQGDTFPMGRSTIVGASDYYEAATSSINEVPEHDVSVAAFALDKYEVTVGRFRKFVEAYDAWHNATPANPQIGDGANPDHQAGVNTGWGQSWTAGAGDLPANASELKRMLNAGASWQNWSDEPSVACESCAMNYVTWHVAFAFCIWDGGRLPTEAEWEFAAVGATQNGRYPWGSEEPTAAHANFLPEGSPKLIVGSKPAGAGAFGHEDLAGSMWEWVFDWYSSVYCGEGCVRTGTPLYRSMRGGSFADSGIDLRAANRSRGPDVLASNVGFRCARNTVNGGAAPNSGQAGASSLTQGAAPSGAGGVAGAASF